MVTEECADAGKPLLAVLQSSPPSPPCSKDQHFLHSLLLSLKKLPPLIKECVLLQIHKLFYENSTDLLHLEQLEYKKNKEAISSIYSIYSSTIPHPSKLLLVSVSHVVFCSYSSFLCYFSTVFVFGFIF